MNIGIYVIKNTVNGKRYVGQSKNLTARWKAHLWCLRNDYHAENLHLRRAWKKYGAQAFVFVIIQRTKKLLTQERYWVKTLNTLHPNGYNICWPGHWPIGKVHPTKGRKWTLKTKAKISKALKGRNHGPERVKAIRAGFAAFQADPVRYAAYLEKQQSNNPGRRGQTNSAEHNRKVSKALRRAGQHLTFDGETKHRLDWLSDPRCKVPRLLKQRLQCGWTVEEAMTLPLGYRRF